MYDSCLLKFHEIPFNPLGAGVLNQSRHSDIGGRISLVSHHRDTQDLRLVRLEHPQQFGDRPDSTRREAHREKGCIAGHSHNIHGGASLHLYRHNGCDGRRLSRFERCDAGLEAPDVRYRLVDYPCPRWLQKTGKGIVDRGRLSCDAGDEYLWEKIRNERLQGGVELDHLLPPIALHVEHIMQRLLLAF